LSVFLGVKVKEPRRARLRPVWRRQGLVLLALLAGVLSSNWYVPLTGRAQETLSLATLQVSLWPEFDQPRTLVILDGTLPPGTPLPAELTLRMPAAAGAPHAVAIVGADGNLLTASYTTNPAGDDIIVSFSANSLSFRLEYYDPALVMKGAARTYTFNWTTDYPVTAAALRVQQPSGATGLAAEPALVDVGVADYGLRYWESSLGALAAGQTVSLALSYTKADSTLSANAVGAVPAAAAAPTAAAGLSAGPNLPLVITVAAVGLALVGAGFIAYVRSARVTPRRSARGRRQRRGAARASAPRPPAGTAARRPERPSGASAPAAAARPQPAPAAALEAEPAFCTQCGQRRQPGDRFCRQCGAALAEV
jgi:hypothetical protein